MTRKKILFTHSQHKCKENYLNNEEYKSMFYAFFTVGSFSVARFLTCVGFQY
jgi:hypothetical protein